MSNQPQIYTYIKQKICDTQFFGTNINVYKVIACFGVEPYNELTKYIFKKYKADLAIIVDVQNNTGKAVKVTSTNNNFNLEKFIKLLCEGSVDNNVGYGKLTKKFLQFTKTLKNVN